MQRNQNLHRNLELGCDLVGRVLAQADTEHWIWPPALLETKCIGAQMPSSTQEVKAGQQKFEVILSYLVSEMLAWAAWDCLKIKPTTTAGNSVATANESTHWVIYSTKGRHRNEWRCLPTSCVRMFKTAQARIAKWRNPTRPSTDGLMQQGPSIHWILLSYKIGVLRHGWTLGKILLGQRSQLFELLIRPDLLHERSRTDDV